MDCKNILHDYGISLQRLNTVQENIETTTRGLFEEYDVELTNEQEVLDAVVNDVFSHVIEFGTEIDDLTIEGQFEMMESDFKTPTGSNARSNIVFITGSLSVDSKYDELVQLSEAIVAENYSRQ